MNRATLAGIGVIFALFMGQLARPECWGDGGRRWTLTVVLFGDSSLEAEYLKWMQRLADHGVSSEIDVSVLFDRSSLDECAGPGYSSEDLGDIKNWSGARELRLCGKRWIDVGPASGAMDTPIDLTNPSTIQTFLSRAIARTSGSLSTSGTAVVVLKGHGRRLDGILDESADRRSLTPRAIACSMPRDKSLLPVVDLLVLDCCDQCSYELLQTTCRSASLLATSQGPLSVEAIDYCSVFGARFDPRRTIVEVAHQLVDACEVNTDDDGTGVHSAGLVVHDLSQFPCFDAAIGRAAAQLSVRVRNEDGLEAAALRSACLASRPLVADPNCLPLVSSCGPSPYFATDTCPAVDLEQLLGAWQYSESLELRRDVRASIRAARQMVVACTPQLQRNGAVGLPVLVPCEAEPTLSRIRENFGIEASATPWTDLIRAVAAWECFSGHEVRMGPVSVSTDWSAHERRIRVSCRIESGEEFAGPSFFVILAGPQLSCVGLLPVERDTSGTLAFDWDGRWVFLRSKSDTDDCAIPVAVRWIRRNPGCCESYSASAFIERNGACGAIRLEIGCGSCGLFASVRPDWTRGAYPNPPVAFANGDLVRSVVGLTLARESSRAERRTGIELPGKLSRRIRLHGPNDLVATVESVGLGCPDLSGPWNVGFMTVQLNGECGLSPISPIR